MKKFLLTVSAGVVMALMPVASASAWTYGLTGSGKCATDGSFVITWTVNNSGEKEALTITDSSNTAVVPVGTKVSKYQKANFTQTADGTVAGKFNLTLKGNWPSDQSVRTRTADVTLKEACPQPAPQVESASTTTPQVEAAQVVAPQGAVNAGSGSKQVSLAAISGLVASIVLGGYGVIRTLRSKQSV